MTIDEMISVLQSAKEGRAVQVRICDCPWTDTDKPDWDFESYEYRAKPLPPEPVCPWCVKPVPGPERYESCPHCHGSFSFKKPAVPTEPQWAPTDEYRADITVGQLCGHETVCKVPVSSPQRKWVRGDWHEWRDVGVEA